MNSIFRFIFCTLWGWKIKGEVTVPKFVMIAVPHTSNWDFIVGLLVRPASNLNHCYYIGKDSLFRFPYGFIFRALGGIPVDRSKSNNFVENVASMFGRREIFGICLAPEGTRKRVEKFKTGFYYIAKTANVPVIMCSFDWGNRTVEYSEPFYLTDNFDKDMAFFVNHFRGIKGKNYVFDMEVPKTEENK